MKYSIKEFASEIRTYNPKIYDDLSDSQVVKQWLQIHPEDKHKLTGNSTTINQTNFKNMANDNSEETSYSGVIFLVLLGVLAFTNPKKEKHIDEVREQIKESIYRIGSKPLSNTLKNDSGNEFWVGVGLAIGEGFVDEMIPKLVNRKNFFFFSLTRISFDGKNNVIGIGLFENVFVFADIDKELKKILKSKYKMNGL